MTTAPSHTVRPPASKRQPRASVVRGLSAIDLIHCMSAVCLFCLLLTAGCTTRPEFSLEEVLRERPDRDKRIFDYVGILADVEESTTRHLEQIQNRYGIEVVIAALPALDRQRSVSETAAQMFTNWRIGSENRGRGILLLLVDDAKEVKLEVGYALEDVFTDAFTGAVEHLQLQPRYAAGDMATGLIALMEELEVRSRRAAHGAAAKAPAGEVDEVYLSQGAGARIALTDKDLQAPFSGEVDQGYPAGRSPEEAWHTMIRRWQRKERNPYLAVFTPTARLAYRDFVDMPDGRFEKDYRTWAGKAYEVRRDGDYAVIYFGRRKGWDNAPFLLSRTREGWQFDLVHQRRFIRMGPAPAWGVEFSDHPHMKLLMDAFRFNGQDIPLRGEDRYTIHQDAQLARRIVAAEAAYASDPGRFETAMALGRLYTIVSMSRKGLPLLQKAKAMKPEDPRPYKYLAIAHVNAHYQYASALKELKAYIAREPEDAFGHNFLGYIYYRQKNYPKAIQSLETALALQPDDAYAHFYLAFAYAGRYAGAMKLDPRRSGYKERFRYHVARTRSFQDTHPMRVRRLNEWLEK